MSVQGTVQLTFIQEDLGVTRERVYEFKITGNDYKDLKEKAELLQRQIYEVDYPDNEIRTVELPPIFYSS